MSKEWEECLLFAAIGIGFGLACWVILGGIQQAMGRHFGW